MIATFESAFPALSVSASPVARAVARSSRRRSRAAAPAVKEYAQMTTAEKRLFNLEKARAARAASVQAAPPASAPEKVDAPQPARAKKGEYVRTNVKLTNYGHGRRETEIDGLRVGIAWDGTKAIFVYIVGKKVFVGGATRDLAVAKLNAALAEQGLPPVRA